MKLSRLVGAGPGWYVLRDGERAVGLWLRVGLDALSAPRQPTGPVRAGEESPETWCPFDQTASDMRSLLRVMVDIATQHEIDKAATSLLVVEWRRELVERTCIGPNMDRFPEARSALAVCQLADARTATAALRGDRWLEVRQIPERALRSVRRDDPEVWLREALHATLGDSKKRARSAPRPAAAAPAPPPSTVSSGLLKLPPGDGLQKDRLGLPLDCHLDRGLECAQPLAGSVIYRQTSPGYVAVSVPLRTLLALTSVLFVAALMGSIFYVRPKLAEGRADRTQPTPLAALPVGLCDTQNEPFLRALRCQIASISRLGALDSDCSPDAMDLAENADLQPDLCGLLDWSQDGHTVMPLAPRGGPFRASTLDLTANNGPALNPAELALSQACFEVLGRPPSYALDTSEAGLRWGAPDRLLRGSDALAALMAVEASLVTDCAEGLDRWQSRLRGAVLATHVGAPAPAEAAALRTSAATSVEADLSPTARPCFEEGVLGGPRADRYSALCGNGAVRTGSASFRALSGEVTPEDPGVGDRYLTARYGDLREASVTDTLLRCHLSLSGAQPAGLSTPSPGAWGAPVPIPATFEPSGAQSELILDAALLGVSGGASLGDCWQSVGAMLDAFPKIHPQLNPIDPKSWLVRSQQVCGQVCAVAYELGAPTAVSRTPGADLAACVSADEVHTPSPTFPLLALPWSGQTSALPPASSPGAWVPADAAQVCAFHLVAQGRLDLGRKSWLPAGLTGRSWAGEHPNGVVGGPDGEAMIAAMGLSGLERQPRAGELECGAVALQCFMGVALDVAGDGSRTRWENRWAADVTRLARQDPSLTAAEAPWCGLIAPYLAPRPITEQLDATCRAGVEEARQGVAETLTLAREQP